MDRRLNKYLEDNYFDENTIFIRNAGANISSLKDTLARIPLNEVQEIIIVTHTDCGAMKVVSNFLNLGSYPKILEPLISPFIHLKGASQEKLENINLEIQINLIKRLTNVKVTGEIVDVKKLNIPQVSQTSLLLTRPNNKRYSNYIQNLFSTYVSQTFGEDYKIDEYIAREFLKVSNIIKLVD